MSEGQPEWKKLESMISELNDIKGKMRWAPNSKNWFDRDMNEKERQKMWTAPYDARFPQINQTNKCWFNYTDYHRCKNLKGEDYEPCNYLKSVYQCVCPISWTDKWDTWIEEGRFPVRTDR